MNKIRFKLTFRQIMVGTQRALVIAIAPVPGQSGWLQAVLALENGKMIQKPITQIEFDIAARHEVTMMEADGEAAPPVAYDLKPGEVR